MKKSILAVAIAAMLSMPVMAKTNNFKDYPLVELLMGKNKK